MEADQALAGSTGPGWGGRRSWAWSGEEDLELRADGFAVTYHGLGGDDAAVEFGEASDDGQSEADAAGTEFGGAGGVA